MDKDSLVEWLGRPPAHKIDRGSAGTSRLLNLDDLMKKRLGESQAAEGGEATPDHREDNRDDG